MSRPRGLRGVAGAALAAFVLLRPAGTLTAQCAMCSTAAGTGQVGRGLSLSVLFLLGTLFLTVGWLALLAFRARSSRRS